MNEDSALVLFSGGQDSTTCLAWALARFSRVETVGFDYGQRHSVELDCRAAVRQSLASGFADWAQRLGPDHVLDLRFIRALGQSAMTEAIQIEMQNNALPNTFVPGRNLLFFTAAAALAYRRGLKRLVGGMCETDYSGYPDCRDDTLKALQATLNLGMESRLVVETPLMWIDKAETWTLARDLGGNALVELIKHKTHTCYVGDRENLHAWGYGCGACPACELRANGYKVFTAMA
ncbi:MAG: 7-cyano-7-deazaguanine synthase QueC [Gammaproteobacteria bacterium]|nr:7-cyano-7-deazaguanine synthase QueC [Gammaproteobacteria bacterium]